MRRGPRQVAEGAQCSVGSRSSSCESSRGSDSVKERTVTEDPFMGIEVGCLVNIKSGPRSVTGKDALVIERDLIVINHGEDVIEDYEANIEVLMDGERVKLWVGWVTKIVDQNVSEIHEVN